MNQESSARSARRTRRGTLSSDIRPHLGQVSWKEARTSWIDSLSMEVCSTKIDLDTILSLPPFPLVIDEPEMIPAAEKDRSGRPLTEGVISTFGGKVSPALI